MPGFRFLHFMRDGRDMAFSENQQQLRKHGDAVLTGEAARWKKPARSIALWSTREHAGGRLRRAADGRAATCASASRTSARTRSRPWGGSTTSSGSRATSSRRPPRSGLRTRSAAGESARSGRSPTSTRSPRPRSSASATSARVGVVTSADPRHGRAPLGDDVGGRDARPLAARRPDPRAVQPDHAAGVSSAPFDRFFQYVCAENEAPYVRASRAHARLLLRRAASAAGDPLAARARSHGDATSASFAVSRVRRARPLLKDPIAVFSSEWLASRFDAQVVVLIRHPAAFASSLVRLGWTHDFGELPRSAAAPARPPRRVRGRDPGLRRAPSGTSLDQAILLWRLIYSTVATFRRAAPGVDVRPPRGSLARARRRASSRSSPRSAVELDDGIRRAIAEHSGEGNPAELRRPRRPARQPRERRVAGGGGFARAGRANPGGRRRRRAGVLRRRGLVVGRRLGERVRACREPARSSSRSANGASTPSKRASWTTPQPL